MKIKAVLLVLVLLIAITSVGFAAMETAKWQTIPLNVGEGLFVPCSTGLVTAYVWDGMATVECLSPTGKK
jgi:hypothetical protein